MSYAYRLISTGASSDKYGACEVCRTHASEVFHQMETRGYPDPDTGAMGYTGHGCRQNTFGHRDCLISLQRVVLPFPAPPELLSQVTAAMYRQTEVAK